MEAFDRLYYESQKKKEEQERKREEKRQEELKSLTFKPNRENTKKADKKFGLNNRSPERMNKYYNDYVEKSKKSLHDKQQQLA